MGSPTSIGIYISPEDKDIAAWFNLLERNHMSRTVWVRGLLAAYALAALAEFMIALLPEHTYENLDDITLDTIFLGASLGAMALFFLCALRLCTRKYFVYTTQPTLHV